MGCANFDALLADALDGTLNGPKLESFERHKAACKTCALMFAETEAGLNWLQQARRSGASAHLVHNILAVTSGTAVATGMAEVAARRPWWERVPRAHDTRPCPIADTAFRDVIRDGFLLHHDGDWA